MQWFDDWRVSYGIVKSITAATDYLPLRRTFTLEIYSGEIYSRQLERLNKLRNQPFIDDFLVTFEPATEITTVRFAVVFTFEQAENIKRAFYILHDPGPRMLLVEALNVLAGERHSDKQVS